jgi:hypothetical protein
MIRRLALAIAVVAVLLLSFAPASAHYVPQAKDDFHYYETITLTNGQGNYTGYSENTWINGSVSVNGILANGTVNTSYQNTAHYVNNQGASSTTPLQGTFTFSPTTYEYVQGTDNETGYSTPLYVWFYMNDSLAQDKGFTLLNTPCNVVSRNSSFPVSLTDTGYATTIFGEGNGSYQRNDDYGVFTASYTWKAYFDPGTGYIVGYVYTETDSNAAGDGFTITDSLTVTSTSYTLTPAAPPPATPASSSDTGLIIGIVVLLVFVILIVVVVVVYSRRRSELARHSVRGNVAYDPARSAPSAGPPPPSLDFGSVSQPSVQQVIIKETVKVNCQYCGTLIDSTAKICPNCGAPRS